MRRNQNKRSSFLLHSQWRDDGKMQNKLAKRWRWEQLVVLFGVVKLKDGAGRCFYWRKNSDGQ